MMQTLINFIVKLLFFAFSLLLAAMLLVVLAFFAALWGIGYVWARLTGRPITPFVMRVDPRAGFGRMHRQAADAAPRPGERRDLADVTDVEAKPPRT